MNAKKSRSMFHKSDLPEEEENIPAWELIDTGRYMPRRIRGSFRGRELG